MTLTFEHLPEGLSQALQKRARREGKSVPEVAIEILATGLGVVEGKPGNNARDLSGTAGTMTKEDAKAIEETVRWMDEGDLSARS